MKTLPDDAPTLVVAGRSARLMAEGARRDGFRVVALDAFGDADTRRASHEWRSIGADGGSHIDAQRLLAELQQVGTTAPADAQSSARSGPLIGWVAGSDFETQPELLAAGAALLPLVGTAPADVRRLRSPQVFFPTLRSLGLPHPPTQIDVPANPQGWLRKLGRGCGGWHIRRADSGAARSTDDDALEPYFQREAPGLPMSALFVARRGGHRLVGINRLIVRPLGAHPHVYRGAVGPVDLQPPPSPMDAQPGAAAALRSLAAAIDALVGCFSLRGLCSLDFLWHEGAWTVLELNPRPSASMALYADQPLMREHVAACVAIASAQASADGGCASAPLVRGIETVFARAAFTLSAAQAQALAARPDCHDLPAAGARFAAGDPVCSVSAVGNNVEEACERLDAERRTLRDAWAHGKPWPDPRTTETA